MTKTREVMLAMIADGKPRTNADLRQEFGLTSQRASDVLHGLVRSGLLVRACSPGPIAYTLTEEGQKFSERRTEAHQARLDKKAKAQAARRAIERGERALSARATAQTIVSRAMNSRPALDMAWGAGQGVSA